MQREPYRGSTETLVIAFDVGTTYSGASFCVLTPGQVPRPITLTSFPGHGHEAGTSKIPTIMYYDHNGRMMCAGAETELDRNLMAIERHGWIKAEWFKLAMCPQRIPENIRAIGLRNVRSLPRGVNVVRAYGDFFGYLLHCTEIFFRGHVMGGDRRWPTLIANAHYIISHPNGWEGVQQAKLRKAAIYGGLISEQPQDRSRIHFVTEGEASMHFCLTERLIREANSDGQAGFIVADFGGGTLDFSSYRITSEPGGPISVTEITEAQCKLEGSALITARAEADLRGKLEGSRYGTDEQIVGIVTIFDKTTKRRFERAQDQSMIRFGTPADRDPQHGIENGSLRVPGRDMVEYFEPSITAAIEVIRGIKNASDVPVESCYLVGGFCASAYLKSELVRRLRPDGIEISVPDSQTAKAVVEGAISFYIDHYVTSRVAKVTYGTDMAIPYDPLKAEHLLRQNATFARPNGVTYVGGAFCSVVKKGELVRETREYKEPFVRSLDYDGQYDISMPIMVYTGPGAAPRWLDQANPEHLKTLFRVHGTHTGPKRRETRSDGQPYWVAAWDIVILFGLTEVKAQICWDEHGVPRSTQAEIIYDELVAEEELENLENEDDHFDENIGGHEVNPGGDYPPPRDPVNPPRRENQLPPPPEEDEYRPDPRQRDRDFYPQDEAEDHWGQYPPQDHRQPVQQFRDEPPPRQPYRDQDPPRQGYRDQGPPRQGYRDEDPPRQGYRDQDPPRQGYRDQDPPRQGAPSRQHYRDQSQNSRGPPPPPRDGRNPGGQYQDNAPRGGGGGRGGGFRHPQPAYIPPPAPHHEQYASSPHEEANKNPRSPSRFSSLRFWRRDSRRSEMSVQSAPPPYTPYTPL